MNGGRESRVECRESSVASRRRQGLREGRLCYPVKPVGLEGPATCIRAEGIRDAREDIKLIWLVRRLAVDQGREACAERISRRASDRVITSHTQYR